MSAHVPARHGTVMSRAAAGPNTALGAEQATEQSRVQPQFRDSQHL